MTTDSDLDKQQTAKEDLEESSINTPNDTVASSNPESEDSTQENNSTEKSNSAKAITLGAVLVLVVMVVVYAASDRLAPSTSRGFVAAHVAQIAPRVSGQIVEVLVADDAIVQAGEPLFSIDSRPFELVLRQAEANLANTMQGIDASAASLVAAQATVTQARTNLDATRADTNRILRLEKRSLVSTAEADSARAKLADAEARLNTAVANLESARAQLGSVGADNPSILAAQAQLESAQYDLASTVVRAPHFGVVTNVTLAKGQFIGAGNPALTFIDAQAAWITIDLRENQLQKLKPGNSVRVLFDAVPGKIFEGHVQSIAWGIDPGRQAKDGLVANQSNNRWFEPARRIPVRVELEGGMDEWPQQVRVGGKVQAVVFTGSRINPVALIVRASQRVRSWASYLY